MVWAVDRLGRSLSHLVNVLSEIHAKKADLFMYQQGIDTTTPAGKKGSPSLVPLLRIAKALGTTIEELVR